jgi:putative Mn2+ efflux pump MntP
VPPDPFGWTRPSARYQRAGAHLGSGLSEGLAHVSLDLLLLATGVSADAFAVALGKGLHPRSQIIGRALLIATAFGLAQAVMPFLGWLLGSTFAAIIAPFDHRVAFGLLALVGGKMLRGAIRPGIDEDSSDRGALSMHELLVLSVATIIDALAVGVSFAFLDVAIWIAVLVIGATSFALSFAAVLLGHRIGIRFQKPAEIVGGVILIAIGVQIVLGHLGALWADSRFRKCPIGQRRR